jgi:excisionase family DNA binding protein
MATRFIQLDEAAEMLGISPDALNEMRSRNELRGFRDGTTWKFKSDDIDRVLADRQRGGAAPAADIPGAAAEDLRFDESGDSDLKLGDESSDQGEESVLLSERELGGSEVIGSSTIIGDASTEGSPDSDIALADTAGGEGSQATDLQLVGDSMIQGSDVAVAGGSGLQPISRDEEEGGSEAASDLSLQFEDMDGLDLESGPDDTSSATGGSSDIMAAEARTGSDLGLVSGSDLSLGGDDNEVAFDSDSGVDLPESSSIDLSEDDDDLVLGGSGSGSDITIGSGDSGISLMDPADSGLSLEGEPLELGGSAIGDESLVLGEDDMVSLGSDRAGMSAATQLKSDDDFLLTPLDSAEDESESGSQVIALDDAGAGFDASAATMLSDGDAGMAMLEEDLADSPTLVGGPAGAASLMPSSQMGPGGVMQPVIPEAPYSIWNVLSLFVCIVMLSFTGMMMYDVVRQIWSWDGAYPANSGMMQSLIDMFK